MSKTTFSRKAIPRIRDNRFAGCESTRFDFSELYTDELLAERWMFRQELEGLYFSLFGREV